MSILSAMLEDYLMVRISASDEKTSIVECGQSYCPPIFSSLVAPVAGLKHLNMSIAFFHFNACNLLSNAIYAPTVIVKRNKAGSKRHIASFVYPKDLTYESLQSTKIVVRSWTLC